MSDFNYRPGKGFTQTVVNYPDRGPWGDASYRGNTTGWIIYDLISTYFPKSPPRKFVELFSGGGTGADVARDMGLREEEHIHLDLINGWDALVDPIPVRADLIFAHPPYWDIVDYNNINNSDSINDLSGGMPYHVFIERLNFVIDKAYRSLSSGGILGILLGDVRKKGRYYEISADISRPGVLVNHIVKIQNNTLSGRLDRQGKYQNARFTRIIHEHLLVIRK